MVTRPRRGTETGRVPCEGYAGVGVSSRDFHSSSAARLLFVRRCFSFIYKRERTSVVKGIQSPDYSSSF